MANGRDGRSYGEAMVVLTAREAAMADGRLLSLLRHDAYAHGINAVRDGTGAGLRPTLARAMERFRWVQSSHAILARPWILEPGRHHGVETRHGIDVRPAALRSFAETTAAWGTMAWDLARLSGFPDPGADEAPLGDHGDLPLDCRYLAARVLALVEPAAHEAAVARDAVGLAAAEAVAFWWTERLVDVAVSPDRRAPATKGQVSAFEARLRTTVALASPSEVAFEYEPDAFLSEALAEAGLPHHALDGWRSSSVVVDRDAGTVVARVGRHGGQVEVASLDGAGRTLDAG